MTGAEPAKVTVVGIGNILMRDDGIGPAVIHRLEQSYEWGSDVEIFDAGAPGMELAYLVEDRDWLILVDAVELSGEPGSTRWFDRDEILAGKIPVRVGPHDPGIREAILKLELVGHEPRSVELLGVVPETVALGSELTEGAEVGVERATEEILSRLAGAGIEPLARHEARPEPPWWQREGAGRP